MLLYYYYYESSLLFFATSCIGVLVVYTTQPANTSQNIGLVKIRVSLQHFCMLYLTVIICSTLEQQGVF